MWKRRFEERTEEARRMKVTPEKMCAIADFCWFFQNTPMWLSRIPQYLILGGGDTTYHLSARFPPNKGQHLSSFYLPPFLPEQYVAGQERWQEERERERGGKTYSTNSIYSHCSSVTGISSSDLSICPTPSPLISKVKTSNLSMYHQLLFLWRTVGPKWQAGRLWFETWTTHWNPFWGLYIFMPVKDPGCQVQARADFLKFQAVF